ncbi:MAG TPA: tetratricopeptide repeat protein, partial [Kofleriaceae bacterium]|nr:tetratricopeptide repeat protein [Kofleriaceae bacterium]
NLSDARARFQAALKISPRYAPAHRGLGLVQERSGQTARAILSLETYLRLAPRAADAAAIRARINRLRK